ncbi:hypothetical protein BJI67_08735 [Acidihalobacter aeolianus]|uniref:Nucleoprotein/polynucleotide-associated enzyme n=1 Tax=Acidihalobacter aeolianus TaxID=2792603 RepID=A0A1D8K863_9GAMM|nr:DUF2058 domain-containing protein [Acidihalobacter aeolianus]AOV17132.1 hypothetical protein BJI67_08735 [Acidihalobacter aeolianus]
MSGSLFDQLKQAGLVDDKKARQVKKEKHQRLKQGRQASAVTDEAARLAAEAVREKQARDRELNQSRQTELKARAEAAALRQLIESNRISDWQGDIAHNFVDGDKIKTLYVNRATHERLGSSALRIARLDDAYALVSTAAAEKIAQRDATVLVALTSGETSMSDEDRAHYARFEVPDDLMW